VGAAESHDETVTLDCPWITAPGPRGGSPVAAAIVNALIRLAEKE
jgi:precorrin-8X/cobalt-precorrin-8 methylmutase